MSNMSYCRFQNTLSDLRDCEENLDDEPQSESEKKARFKLIELCQRIANDYGNELD